MAKKTSKSNKTSHVLNLLTNGSETETGNTEQLTETLSSSPEDTGAENAPAPRKRRSVSSAVKRKDTEPESRVTVIDETSENDRLSGEIRRKLEESLRQGGAEPGEKRIPEKGRMPEPERTSEPEAAPARTEPDVPKVTEALIKDEKAADEYEEKEISGAGAGQKMAHKSFHIVNVMDSILRQQDIPGFMAQYGCCTCERCVTDVTALALTRLPAKYVVLEKDATSPMIGFYQSRYRTEILASLLRACLAVKEAPRHDR